MKNKVTILLIFIAQSFMFGQSASKDKCEILSIDLDYNGVLHWTTKNEKSNLPFIIEQYRWNKWIKVTEVKSNGTPEMHIYETFMCPINGENKIRIKQGITGDILDSTNLNMIKSELTFSQNPKKKEIEFSDVTLYEILDTKGTLVKKGWAKSVSYSNMPDGKYELHFDKSITFFKK